MITMHIKVLEALPLIPPWIQIYSSQYWLYVSIWLNQRPLLSPCKWNLWSFFQRGSSYVLNSVHGVASLPNPKLPAPGSFSTLSFLCTFHICQIQIELFLSPKCLSNLPRLSLSSLFLWFRKKVFPRTKPFLKKYLYYFPCTPPSPPPFATHLIDLEKSISTFSQLRAISQNCYT